MRVHILFVASAILLGLCPRGHSQNNPIAPPAAAPKRASDAQVAVQLQIVSIPEAHFEKIVTPDWLATHRAGSFDHGRIALLNDAERKELIRSLHQDKRTETLASPTLRMLSGQKASIDTTEEMYFLTDIKAEKHDGVLVPVPQNERKEVGFKAKVQATVSGDRRHVHIDLDAKRTALESQNIPLIPYQFPITQAKGAGEVKDEPKAANRISPPRQAGSVEVPAPEFRVIPTAKGQPQVIQMFLQRPSFSTQTVAQKFNVPDGGTTVIVLGKERREVRQVNTPLAAAALPFGKELFGTVSISREPHVIVMLVTPRIVINEEIEREILGSNTPAPPKAPTRAEQVMVTYPVADLLSESPNSDFEAALEAHARRRADGASMTNAEPKNPKPAIDLLIDSILKTVRPDSWQGAGGKGVIQYFPLFNSLVITNTKQVHQEVEALLQAARRSREVQVVLDIQVVSVVDGTWEKVADLNWIPNHNHRLAFLNQKECTELIDTMRKDKRTEFIASPRLTTHNGQKAVFDATEERSFCTDVVVKRAGKHAWLEPKNIKKEIGFKAQMHATISADRRFVKVDLDAVRTHLDPHSATPIPIQVPLPPLFDAPNGQGFIANKDVLMKTFVQRPTFSTLGADMSLNVPDGATAVIVAGTETCGDRTLLVLATPRIVIDSEIEREILGLDTPTKPGDALTRTKRAYYSTGGLLKAKRLALPIDYDLTVVEAVVLAAGPLVNGGFSTDPDWEKKAAKSSEMFAAKQILVLRREKDGATQQVVDMDRALNNPAENLVVRDGDVLILQDIPTGSPKTAAKNERSDAAQVYYTGGIDIPRQHPLPRDRELKVTQAIAGKLTRVGPDDPMPSEVLVIRRTKSGEQTQIRVDLARAILDPSHDPVVQNGDFLVLQESPADTLARLSRGIARDIANVRSAPRDLSEQAEPRQPTPRR